MRATFPELPTKHDECGKLWDLPTPFDCGVAVAGALTAAQPFVDQLFVNLKKLGQKRIIHNEHVENEIDDARYRVWRRRADWAMKMSYGLSLSQWQQGKVPGGKLDPLTLKAGEVLIQSTILNLEVIVAGFIRGRILFYKASGKRPLELAATPGVQVIGTGGALAMDRLNRRGQNSGYSFARSVLHVAEALDEAQKEPAGTVGKASNFLAIAKDGSMSTISPRHLTLLQWKRAYRDRESTWSLQNSKLADLQAKSMARVHRRS
jgi:hypothetical protein